MQIKYNLNSDKILLVELKDLILSKVDHLSGDFEIFFEPLDIIGLYNYKEFSIRCSYKISKVANSFLVKMDINSLIPTFCDLCGNRFQYDFRISIEEVFTTLFEYKKNFEDMYYFVFNGQEIDIGRVCVENFISNLPLRFHDGCNK
ncbi:MAG: hypothetical protein ACK4GR_03635 [bacterium]